MICPHCGLKMTPVNHNNRGERCPMCWGRVEMEEAKSILPGEEESEEVSEIDVTPSARRLATQYGVDLSTVAGSGAGGKVLKSDVEKYL